MKRLLILIMCISPIISYAQLKGQHKEVVNFSAGSLVAIDGGFLSFKLQKTFREKRIVMPASVSYNALLIGTSPELNVMFGFGYALKPNVDLIVYPFWYNDKILERDKYAMTYRTPSSIVVWYRLPHFNRFYCIWGVDHFGKSITPRFGLNVNLITSE